MKKVLIGPIIDGHAGGIDRYMLNLFNEIHGEQVQFDFYTSKIESRLKQDLSERRAHLFEIADLKHPLRQYMDFKHIFQKEKYDTVYFNFSTALGFLGPIAAKKCGIKKIVIHSHTTDFDISNPYKRKLMTILHTACRKILYRYGTDFYACSTEAGNWLFPNEIVNSERFQIAKNSIQLEKFLFNDKLRMQVRQELNLENACVIGHVGNFVYQKNHEFLLEAFCEFSKNVPNAKLLLIGDGVLFEMIQMKAAQLNIQDMVIFLGRRADANVYLQAMDIFAFPSNFEGLGIVAIEAQAAGLPCICSNHVPLDAGITDLCKFVSIDADNAVALWSKAFEEAKGRSRKDMTEAVTAAGYNIHKQELIHLV